MDESSSYTLIKPLKEGITSLVVDSVRRKLVLKILPSDCLWRGQLHPNVSDRLLRLRELPSTSFQGLTAVEVHEKGVMIIWPFVEGKNLRECDEAARTAALKQLPRIVASLHRVGMVHGAIHAGNVIIDRQGKAILIDPSPLLHDDFDVDLIALNRLGCEESAKNQVESVKSAEHSTIRRRSLLAALALLMAAIASAWFIRQFVGQ